MVNEKAQRTKNRLKETRPCPGPHASVQTPPLTVENFNNVIEAANRCGAISRPPIPCNASNIDPTYIRDANARQGFRRYLVKTNILRLREITRTKFFFYTNQELALEEKRRIEFNQRIYESMVEFYRFCYGQLAKMERQAFDEMQQKYTELDVLRMDRRLHEVKDKLTIQHERIYTRVFEAYQRFRYLLKLIEYFDSVSGTCDGIVRFNRQTEFLDAMPMQHGAAETTKLRKFVAELIRPYLEEKAYMDASVWERSYQTLRRRIANYNQHLTRVALLHHFMEMIYDKFMKLHRQRLTVAKFLDADIDFLVDRTHFLEGSTEELLATFGRDERKDRIKPMLEGIVPVMEDKLALNRKPMDIPQEQDRSVIDKLQKIQQCLMHLLYELDMQPALRCRQIERTVRMRVANERVKSKEALVLQTRFDCLLDHYRTHYRTKNLERTQILVRAKEHAAASRRTMKMRRGKVHPQADCQ